MSLAFVTLAVLLRVGMLRTLYDGDTELFVYMGKLFGQGGRVGTAVLDNKLPSVGLLMWPAYACFGAWWPGYWLLGIALGVITVAAVTRAAARVNPASFWPTLAIAAAWLSFPMTVFCSFKLEHVETAAAAVAAWLVVRWWQGSRASNLFFAGLCAGVGTLAKPTALAVLAAFGLALLLARPRPRRACITALSMAAVGLLVPLGVFAVDMVRTGTLATLPETLAQIRSYNRNSSFDPEMLAAKLGFVAFLIATPLLLRGVVERRGRLPAGPGGGGLMLFAVAWLAFELAGVVLQGRMYGYHFLPLAAPAALAFGLIPRRPGALAVAGACGPVAVFSVYWFWCLVWPTVPPPDRTSAMDYVKAHAASGDGVWMDQYARLLVDTDLKPGSAVPLVFLFSNDDAAPTRFAARLCADLRERRPQWVVLPVDCRAEADRIGRLQPEFADHPARRIALMNAWTRLECYVQSAYTPAARCGNLQVYERMPDWSAAD